MNKEAKIFVAGHTGLVGSAIVRNLERRGFDNIVLRKKEELDLTNAKQTSEFMCQEKPDFVFIAAARVGGILENSTYPAEFIHENLAIASNIIHYSYVNKVRKVLYLGSSCIYPRHSPQPMHEQYLMTGPLEPTNEAYAMSKIAGIKMCQAYNKQYGTNFICAMPTNLYGPGDNFDLNSSHALPALIRKCIEAKENGRKEIVVWGTGTPKREFMYVDDLAEAIIFLMKNYSSSEIINVGTGEDISIIDLALLVKDVVGFNGDIVLDESKPDGMPRKWLNVDRLHQLGWQHKTDLRSGILKTYQWYMNNKMQKAVAKTIKSNVANCY